MKNHIITYLLIILLPTIAGFIVYDAMQDVLMQESIREFESEVIDIADYIDDQLEQSDALAKQLSMSRRVRNYQLSISRGTTEASYAAYEALGEFASIRSAYNGIATFFVWFSKDDSILWESTRMTADEFFEYIYCTENTEELLSYDLQGALLHCEVEKPHNALDATYLPYVITLSLPYANPNRYTNLVVLLSVAQFEDYVSKSELVSAGYLSVADADGNMLFTVGEVQQANENQIEIKADCANKNITVCASVPNRIITDKTYSVRIRFIFMLLILFIIDLAIALFSLFKNYRVLRRTVEVFGERGHEKGLLNINLGDIYDAALDITEREHMARLELQTALPMLHDNLLNRIFLGVEPPSRLGELGVSLTASTYSVGIIEPVFDGSFRVLSIALRDLLHSFFKTSILCTTDDEKNTVMFLLSDYNVKECESFFKNAENELGCRLHIFISASFSSVDCIQRAFKQVFLLHKRGTASDGVYIYGVSEPGFRFFDYSIETEAQLVNRVRSGDAQCTEALLAEIILRNAQNDAVTNENFKNSLVDTAINILNELDRRGISNAKLSALFNNFLIERGISEKETFDLFLYMTDLFAQNNAKAGSVASRVVEYVKDNFTDVNCSVSTAASVLNLNTSYLSSVFKSQTGENLSDYITYMRIDLAKRMLVECPEMSIAKIAESTGFASETVLNRNFKKLTGTTPGKFKSFTKNIPQEQ